MDYSRHLCEKCNGILEVIYLQAANVRDLRKDFWSYEAFLPDCQYKHYKLGNTTLLPAREEDIFLKLEMENERKAFYKEYGLQVEMAGVASLAAFRKIGLKGKSVAVISGGNTLKP